jgi:uncharacterized protein
VNLVLRIVGVALIALMVPACQWSPVSASATEKAATVPLQVRTATGIHKFQVEVARTPEQQERGLMFRDLLPPNEGMIFPLSSPRVASFWMKNCPAPIDMIFVRADGSIARIAEAVPYELTPVDSGEPVVAVLEIAGGRAAALGISEDDHVIWDDKAR